MSVCSCVRMITSAHTHQRQEVFLGCRNNGGCEQSNIDDENKSHVLCKSSNGS